MSPYMTLISRLFYIFSTFRANQEKIGHGLQTMNLEKTLVTPVIRRTLVFYPHDAGNDTCLTTDGMTRMENHASLT